MKRLSEDPTGAPSATETEPFHSETRVAWHLGQVVKHHSSIRPRLGRSDRNALTRLMASGMRANSVAMIGRRAAQCCGRDSGLWHPCRERRRRVDLRR